MVMGSYLTISKWRPNFTPTDTISPTTLIWVWVSNIPIEMFKEKYLLRLGNSLGRAVKVDTTSSEVVRGNFARICVEIDLTQPLKPYVMIIGQICTVEYEGLTRICFHCGHFGHSAAICPRLLPPPPAASTNTEEVRTEGSPTSSSTPLAPQSPFGPWMLPAYVRKKQQLQQKRMQQKAAISDENRRLNALVERELAARRQAPSGSSPNHPIHPSPEAMQQSRGRQKGTNGHFHPVGHPTDRL